MDERLQIDRFIKEADFLDVGAIIDMVGISNNYFYRWMANPHNDSSRMKTLVSRFIETDGRRLLEITKEIRKGRKDRIALHQKRAEILKKTRTHQTANQRVSSQLTK